jgi:hypothetical protein
MTIDDELKPLLLMSSATWETFVITTTTTQNCDKGPWSGISHSQDREHTQKVNRNSCI